MKNLHVALIALCTLRTVSGDAQTTLVKEQNPTASALVGACQDFEKPTYRGGMCTGFIKGAISGFAVGAIALGEAISANATTGTSPPKSLHIPCVPAGATSEEIVKVVLKYIDDHPESLHYSAASEIYMAVINAWGKQSQQIAEHGI